MISVNCNLVGYVPGRAGGAEVFLEGLLPQICSFEEINVTVHGSAATRSWLQGFIEQQYEFNEIGTDSPSVINRFLASRKLRSSVNTGEIVWSPLNQGIGGNRQIKEVLTIHDLIPLHYKKHHPNYGRSLSRQLMFSLRWKNSMSTARRASAVVTVSNSNVEELQAAIGLELPRVFGAPNGIDREKLLAAVGNPWQFSGNPNVLAVTSGSKPHKGIKTLEAVATAMPHVTFSLVGKATRTFDQKNIVATGHLSLEQLNRLYQSSSALFFPSRIEGFGLPVLEALVFGTPVVTTDIPVLREVGGSSSAYFPLDDIEAAKDQLSKVITNREAAEAMSTAGQAHARQFTWENAASVYRQVFNDVLKQPQTP